MLLTFLLLQLVSLVVSDQPPFWPLYPTRTVTLLNGRWQFGYQAKIADVLSFDPGDAKTPNVTIVPSCFDITPPGIEGPRGTAFYRRNFPLPANTEGLLYFAACSFYCRVFVDNKDIGDHRAGGYVPFWLKVPASSQTTRELLVLVDDRFNSTTAPLHTGGDFWNYAGITRDVLLHVRPATTYLHQVETFTLDLNGNIKVRVVLGGDTIVSSINITISYDHGATRPMTLEVQDGVATFQDKVPNPTLWSIKRPNLHNLTVSTDSDAIKVRFGLRLVGNRNGLFTLNNEVVKLHGFNRHTMWPDTGSALTLDQIRTDVRLLKQLNVNYVRGAHYPQDQRFLDLCDESGIVVWEETLGPGVSVHDLQDAYWMKYQLQQVDEMISASINHPSVIFFAFYNEGPSSDHAACSGYNQSATAIRARVGDPPTRLVTWASDKRTSDVCFDIADVLSFNAYPGWYDHAHNLSYVVPFWDSQVQWVQEHYPQKIFTISETGGGGVYEWQNETDPFWSQKYEAELLNMDAGYAMNNSRISGLTIWQFNDIKANDDSTRDCGQCVYAPHPVTLSEPWNCAYINVSCGRPGGENHKGSVDFWRRTKESFTMVQQIYGAVP